MFQPRLIDGNAIAIAMRTSLADQVELFSLERGQAPGLAVVLAGDDPASLVYVTRKARLTRDIGMRSIEHRLEANVSQRELLELIRRLNDDPAVHGILVQLPLPPQIEAAQVLSEIDPLKDVDGFHPLNAGYLSTGNPRLIPCTALGAILLIESIVDELAGLNAVVIGRSNIVGKPTALLLLQRGCTTTIAHSRSVDLPEIVSGADILVAAAGRPGLVQPAWIKPGAVVIDVGINRVFSHQTGKHRLVGDVVQAELSRARAFTPVPGGVGPMTIACLLKNTLTAARAQS